MKRNNSTNPNKSKRLKTLKIFY